VNDLWYGTSGPKDAPIVLVGEAWGSEELAAKRPFVGSSGTELTRILAEAGINRDDILLTNIVADRPYGNQMWRYFDAGRSTSSVRGLSPTEKVTSGLKRVRDQIGHTPRQLIIGAGNYPLWAFTSVSGTTKPAEAEDRYVPTGIMNWRGSMWYDTVGAQGKEPTRFLPIIHPAAILRQWSLRAITVHDLKARVPMALRGDWRPSPEPIFWAPPTYEQALSRLGLWLRRAESGDRFRLAADIETIPSRKVIACIGFADSKNFAMTIPFVDVKPGEIIVDYWRHEQEVEIIKLLRRLLTHPNVELVGQNFNYDNQYIQNHWAITPLVHFDTMSAQHLLWPGTPKGLDYISSLYCNYHWYWKEDGKDWVLNSDLRSQLLYNCWDCVRTYEAAEGMQTVINQLGLQRQWEETRERHWLALSMMNRGVRIDIQRRADQGRRLMEQATALSHDLDRIIPADLLPPPKKGAKPTKWYDSPLKQKWVFQEILGIKLPKKRSTGRATLDKNALLELGRKYPQWLGIIKRLGSLRSVEVFQSHFIGARLSRDSRMRCFFKIDGTETFRWSSSQNAFGEGANLQTIPAGDEE
jgi:uracil-DNA glycosylase